VPQPKGEGHPYAALTDYLNVTFPLEYSESWVATFLTWVTGFLGRGLGGLAERNRGLHGYKRSFAFDSGGALLACGGQAGTAFLSLPGEACALVPDWQDAAFFFEKVVEARITRWDGAVDDFEGTHSVDEAVSEFLSGGFNAGGNRPSCSQAGNWIAPDGKGRTFYVGRRENGKLMRIYEKGKQLGDPDSPWVRWELELHNTDREIPFDVLLQPGRYVAGAYPATSWVQAEASRIRTIVVRNNSGFARFRGSHDNNYGTAGAAASEYS
jgi:phage replication initiation protein